MRLGARLLALSLVSSGCGAATTTTITTTTETTAVDADMENGNGEPVTCAIPRLVSFSERVLLMLTDRDEAAMAAWATTNASAVDAEVARTLFRITDSPEMVRAAHILFAVDETADAATRAAVRARATATLARALSGEPFDVLARERTEDLASWDEPLPWFQRGMMVAAFETACFDAPALGVVPTLVETAFGYHVVTVLGHRLAGAMTEADLRADVIEELYEEERIASGRRTLEAALDDVRAGRASLDATLDAVFGRLRAELFEGPTEPVTGPEGALFFGPYGQRVETAPIPAIVELEAGELLSTLLPDDRAFVLVVGDRHVPIGEPECVATVPLDDADLLRVLHEAGRSN